MRRKFPSFTRSFCKESNTGVYSFHKYIYPKAQPPPSMKASSRKRRKVRIDYEARAKQDGEEAREKERKRKPDKERTQTQHLVSIIDDEIQLAEKRLFRFSCTRSKNSRPTRFVDAEEKARRDDSRGRRKRRERENEQRR
ncbi:hypothetical protein PUN28_010534 [Cardiocondyla obscurior]|uniref:Uncharacterized protein n=1 Tax=Cardiocondyla obscurior TaxID=286306 RepID=A0AAW2FK38_9HYME